MTVLDRETIDTDGVCSLRRAPRCTQGFEAGDRDPPLGGETRGQPSDPVWPVTGIGSLVVSEAPINKVITGARYQGFKFRYLNNIYAVPDERCHGIPIKPVAPPLAVPS